MQRDSGHPDRYSIIDIGDRFDQKAYGVAVRKSRRSLVDILNAAIKTLKANSEIDRLLNENIARVSGSTERP